MDFPLVAVTAAALYGALSWALGDVFPFSRYAMYADVRGREQGAVLYVRAGTRDVHFDEIVGWRGIEPAAIDPSGVPCSLQWVVLEAQRWIAAHRAVDAAEDEVEVEVGYRILRVAADGTIHERREQRARGFGRWAG